MIRTYFNRQADEWDDTVAEKDPSKLEKMAARLDIEPGSTVLDVGTGTGVFVPFLLQKIGPSGKLVCLDFAEAMLEKARAKNFQGNLEYVCADILNTDFADEFFDDVVCYSSFPHFADKPAALREIRRVLKRGGRLFICHTSSRDAINAIHRHIALLSDDTIPEKCDMQEMLEEAGFTNINIEEGADNYLARAYTPPNRR
jgi:ubiquinone/menaquinone biosynthesis C-methylase UbiE